LSFERVSSGMNNFFENLSQNVVALVEQGLRFLPGETPKTVVLELRGAYPVTSPPNPLPIPIPLPGQTKVVTLDDLQDQLERLAQISSLKELVVLERGFEGGFATAFAVRGLFEKFRKSGKRITFYADEIGNLSLYLGSACDQIVTLSEGQVNAVGLAARVVFLGETLKKIGIELEVERRSEFKNAPERFTATGFSASYRQNITGLLEGLYDQWLEVVANGRKLSTDALRQAVDNAPLLSEQALEAGLIDKIAFEDELTLNATPMREALRFAPSSLQWDASEGIALVSLEGTISDGESRNVPIPIPLLGGKQAGGYSIVRALRSAAQDKNIKAIVFQIDSPGGSALASELIWREVARAKQVKPVIAVMGEYAASGGYYVACNASKILAAPGTVTGSIGVFNLHANSQKLWERLGFTPETIKLSSHADFFSPDRPLSESEHAKNIESVERVYDTFRTRVADGRSKTLEEVETLARGRVWTGLQAKENGLVDEIGTVFDAIALAKKLSGLPESAPVIHFTPPTKFIASTDLNALAKILETRTRTWAIMPELLEVVLK
jgi:protease IV